MSASASASNSPQSAAARDVDAPQGQGQDACEPPLALPQLKQRGKKRQWVSDTFQSLLGSVGGGGEGESDADEAVAVDTVKGRVSTSVAAVVKANQGGDRETALELERLLGEVSSYEGRLDNLDKSIPDRIDGDGDGEDIKTKIMMYKFFEACRFSVVLVNVWMVMFFTIPTAQLAARIFHFAMPCLSAFVLVSLLCLHRWRRTSNTDKTNINSRLVPRTHACFDALRVQPFVPLPLTSRV